MKILRMMVLAAALGSAVLAAPASVMEAPSVALQGVPLIRQGYNDCGPASIAMVLGYFRVPVDVGVISRATKASPRSYMTVDAIGQYVAPYGLETAVIRGGQLTQVRALIRLGVPTIALQYFQEVGKVPHFRVPYGFDDQRGWLFVADPLAGAVRIRYQDFGTLWNTQGRIFVAVYPPALRAKVLRALAGHA
ncbi:cysteine peptidase family C39 domain-containing protein [Deinococcus sp. Leaf326]|uniref:cysteine peptidase family C39 domain-containing protein n=1 Tax=Deinococcus sp. Leaf326 TaxID=1736338 RepID=UPI001F454959|nr:cysteine peptidase family C39 domain-containing protein [Deinococcus sp. Leaf326]